jgi:hypothetical protein
MSEEQNMEKKGENVKSPPAGGAGEGENQNDHFPEDSHAPKTETSNLQPAFAHASADKPAVENMETHAEHLHKAPGHGFKHYLFEFLMLFLAVFCGFLAENWREHIVESNREKQYVKSFYEDLTADERDLQSNINFLTNQMREADSLQLLMVNISTRQPANHIYMSLRGITRSSAGLLFSNDRTIVQLRNAGGMRLIRNKNVSDSMVAYYRTVEIIQFLSNDALANKERLRVSSMPLMNAEDYTKIIDSAGAIINPAENIFLRKADPDIINSCLIEVNRIKTLNNTLVRRIESLKQRAGRIKAFIKKEYHLKNE